MNKKLIQIYKVPSSKSDLKSTLIVFFGNKSTKFNSIQIINIKDAIK